MEQDDRGGMGYVNPVYLMAHSGARGGVEQIRQLAGMRGFNGQTGPVRLLKRRSKRTSAKDCRFSNTSVRLTVLVRVLADTALKTADSGLPDSKTRGRCSERRDYSGRM